MSSPLQSLDRVFRDSHDLSLKFLKSLPDTVLFKRPRELPRTFTMFSIGEYLIRSAAEVEQVIGGITTRLWDDPFEWTLPEELYSIQKVADYLAEVEAARVGGFAYFTGDDDLSRAIPAPEQMRTIFELLTEAAVRSAHYQGRAFAMYQLFSDDKLPSL